MADPISENLNSKILSSMDDKLCSGLNQGEELLKATQNNGAAFKEGISSLGQSLGKSFSLKSLGDKIGDTFNKGFKSFTNPFSKLGSTLKASFAGLKTTLASPFKAIGGKIGSAFGSLKDKIKNPISAAKDKVKNVIKKPVDKIKSLFGKNDEQTKAKFYKIWSHPKAAAKIFAKEFGISKNKSNKETKTTGKSMTMENLFASVAGDISRIADAVVFFCSGGGFGIGLAIGLTPPILLLAAAIIIATFLICKLIEKLVGPLVEPISNVVKHISELVIKVTNIYDKILGVFDSPLSAVTKGVSVAVDALGNKLKPNEISENMELNTMLFRIYNNWTNNVFNPILNYLKTINTSLQDFTNKIKGNLLQTLQDISSSIKKLTRLSVVKQITPNNENIFGKYNLNNIVENQIKQTNVLNSFKTTFEQIYDLFKGFFEGLKLNNTSTPDILNTQQNQLNPFNDIIKSFEVMRTDTIKLLSEIRNSVLKIELNKITIGSSYNMSNTGEASDAKQTNNLQNITLNNTIDIKSILDRLDSANTTLRGILTNTTPKNEPLKDMSTWSLEDKQ